MGMKLYVTDPPVRRAANKLFGPGAIVNDDTIFKFEEAYNCRIERVTNSYGKIPTVRFNSEKDYTFFVLRWS